MYSEWSEFPEPSGGCIATSHGMMTNETSIFQGYAFYVIIYIYIIMNYYDYYMLLPIDEYEFHQSPCY